MTNHRIHSGGPKRPTGPKQQPTQPAAPAVTPKPQPVADTFVRSNSPAGPAQPASSAAETSHSVIPPGMPLGNTARVGEALGSNPNNPVAAVGAAVVLPLALAADTLDLLAGPPVQHSESTTVTHRGHFEITTHTSITITRGNPDSVKGDTSNGR